MCVCVCVCVRACVRTRAQSYLTLCDPMDCCLPGASVHGILQARILEWEIFIFELSIGLPVTVRCMVWSDDLLPNPASSPPPFLSEMSDSHHWVEDFPCPVLLQSPLNCHRFGPNKHLNLQFHFSIYFPEAPTDLYDTSLHSQSQMWISGSKLAH